MSDQNAQTFISLRISIEPKREQLRCPLFPDARSQALPLTSFNAASAAPTLPLRRAAPVRLSAKCRSRHPPTLVCCRNTRPDRTSAGSCNCSRMPVPRGPANESKARNLSTEGRVILFSKYSTIAATNHDEARHAPIRSQMRFLHMAGTAQLLWPHSSPPLRP
jgi:hypothetical protein